MAYKQCIIVLPCHSLEDFPTHHEGDEAQSLLAGWTALFHPGLLASTGAMPEWWRVDDPGDELENRLLVIPHISVGDLPTGFAQRAKNAGAKLIRRKLERAEILAAALEDLESKYREIDPELVADFLALGFAYLQIQLLTRQMRYSCNLDEVHFSEQIVAGALAAVEGDTEQAKQKLTACFDVLAEERDHYYAVEAFVIDLTLLAPTTTGPSLLAELNTPGPKNLLATGEVIEKIANEQPATLELIRSGIEAKTLTVVGGETIEQRLPTLSLEHLRSALADGQSHAQSHLGSSPVIFGRRTFGLTPTLPQVLNKLGFKGAIHATLEDGRFPEGQQLKTRWEGSDHSAIDAIARPPLNATEPQTFLGFATKLGETMDMDHVATIFLAHWPGQASCWYDDLKRIASYGPVLGRMVTLEEYFSETDFPAHLDRFEADQYSSPYLKQDVIRNVADPISSRVRYWKRHATKTAANKLDALASLVTGKPTTAAADEATPEDLLSDDMTKFADALPRKGEPEQGYLVANPLGFTQRVGLDVSELAHAPVVETPVYAADESTDRKLAVVDVPAMGFAWISGNQPFKPAKKPLKPLVQDLIEDDQIVILQNEFLQATINTVTGTMQSLHDYKTRGNRMSQQLAMRLKQGRGVQEHEMAELYSVMAADETKVVTSTSTLGEVETRGRLLERDGETVATFVQRYQVWRGSRVLRLQVEINAEKELRSDPWNQYCCLRLAWADEGAQLWRTVNELRHKVDKNRFETSHYVEIDNGESRTTLLTGGLPYHRRQGLRMMDSLLLVRGETQSTFDVGIGIDLTHPMQQANELLTPPTATALTAPPTTPASSSWLFHVSARNVQSTWWEPQVDGGSVVGFRVRLAETDGRKVKVKLSSFRPVSSAQQVDFQGNVTSDCTIEDGVILLELNSHEWTEIVARW